MPTSFRWGCDLAWLMPLLQTSPDSEAALSLYTRRKIAERLVGRRVGVLVLSGLALAVFLGAMAYLMGFFPQIGGLADGLAQVAEIGRGLVR